MSKFEIILMSGKGKGRGRGLKCRRQKVIFFINNNINKTNKNYPVGEKQTGKAGQGRVR